LTDLPTVLIISQVTDLMKMVKAHRFIEAGEQIGKIVVNA
jgi:hypothetical protein